MEINLSDPQSLTLENVKKLISSGVDETHTQLRVSKSGIAYLSKSVSNEDVEDIAFRLEIWLAGNNYVGNEAAADEVWVTKIFNCLKSSWPTPKSSFIDLY